MKVGSHTFVTHVILKTTQRDTIFIILRNAFKQLHQLLHIEFLIGQLFANHCINVFLRTTNCRLAKLTSYDVQNGECGKNNVENEQRPIEPMQLMKWYKNKLPTHPIGDALEQRYDAAH